MNTKPKFVRNIFSSKENEVLDALEVITEKGYSELVSDLVKIYSETVYPSVKEKVNFILSNLKDQNSTQYLSVSISLIKDLEVKANLISCCWQNGLDYSNYLADFVEIIANDDFNCAIESFSVIESNYSNLEEKELNLLKTKAKLLLDNPESKNLSLLEEVYKLF